MEVSVGGWQTRRSGWVVILLDKEHRYTSILHCMVTRSYHISVLSGCGISGFHIAHSIGQLLQNSCISLCLSYHPPDSLQ